jgi:hypothetical protein
MPFFSLSELARLRLEVISFFLLVILLVAGCVLGLWRALRKDFPHLPAWAFAAPWPWSRFSGWRSISSWS